MARQRSTNPLLRGRFAQERVGHSKIQTEPLGSRLTHRCRKHSGSEGASACPHSTSTCLRPTSSASASDVAAIVMLGCGRGRSLPRDAQHGGHYRGPRGYGEVGAHDIPSWKAGKNAYASRQGASQQADRSVPYNHCRTPGILACRPRQAGLFYHKAKANPLGFIACYKFVLRRHGSAGVPPPPCERRGQNLARPFMTAGTGSANTELRRDLVNFVANLSYRRSGLRAHLSGPECPLALFSLEVRRDLPPTRYCV